MKRVVNKKLTISPITCLLLSSGTITLFYNGAFWSHVFKVYPLNLPNLVGLTTIFIVKTLLLTTLFIPFTFRISIRPLLSLLFIISSCVAYFSDSFNTIYDVTMIKNMVQTNKNEILDLLSVSLFLYLGIGGILPLFLLSKVDFKFKKLVPEIVRKVKWFISLLFISILLLLLSSKFVASFLREHKPLRYYSNPTYLFFSVGKYVGQNFSQKPSEFLLLDRRAKIERRERDRKLIILVVGETARADRFSLNNPKLLKSNRKTNPLLEKEDVFSFKNVLSCGTSTAVSLPCMFAYHEGNERIDGYEERRENLLDVLKNAGVNVLWRDNNSDSKGVALRIKNENFQHPNLNPICDKEYKGECRDEGMLHGLDTYLNSHAEGDFVIVLHQMGSHGPAYYKRYPKEFEKFTPTCKTSELANCTRDEITNTYDNTILYTDYFLHKTIQFLKENAKKFKTSLIYVSDHGESLGENGIYLHALPYAISPIEQRNVPLLFWLSDNSKDYQEKKKFLKKSQSLEKNLGHNFLFHTVLGLLEIKNVLYRKELDLLGEIKN